MIADPPRGAVKNCRILLIFDPRREAIMLVGGDETGQWATWYATAIPRAEQLCENHLDELDTNQ